MKHTHKQKTTIGIILNFVIFIITTIVMVRYALKFDGQGPLGEFTNGLGSLRTFTNESNIFCALTSLILAIVGIRNLITKTYNFSKPLKVLQLIATTTVVLTFTIVTVFLNPMRIATTGNLFDLFSNEMFFTHFLTPLLATLTFIFFTPSKAHLKTVDNFLALAPIIIYGIVYLTNVIFLQTWPDFYNFTLGGQTQFIPLVFAIILAGSFGIAHLLTSTQNKS